MSKNTKKDTTNNTYNNIEKISDINKRMNIEFEKNIELLREKEKNQKLQQMIKNELTYDLFINNYKIFLLKLFKYKNINLAMNMNNSILFLGITFVLIALIFHFILFFSN